MTDHPSLFTDDAGKRTGAECGLSTQRPRRVELVEVGLVRDSGRTRETESGREATVWEVARQ